MNAKQPCPCGSLVPAAQCCRKRGQDVSPPKETLAKNRERRRQNIAAKPTVPRGFPITVAQLRHADVKALARLVRFLGVTPGTYDGLASLLNEGVTVQKRAHVAVNRRVG